MSVRYSQYMIARFKINTTLNLYDITISLLSLVIRCERKELVSSGLVGFWIYGSCLLRTLDIVTPFFAESDLNNSKNKTRQIHKHYRIERFILLVFVVLRLVFIY